MPNLRPASYGQTLYTELTKDRLVEALEYAKAADCPKLCARIRLAISSAKGAVRHVRNRHSIASK